MYNHTLYNHWLAKLSRNTCTLYNKSLAIHGKVIQEYIVQPLPSIDWQSYPRIHCTLVAVMKVALLGEFHCTVIGEGCTVRLHCEALLGEGCTVYNLL